MSNAAIFYNVKASRTIWTLESLPSTFQVPVDTDEFTRLVQMFQDNHGLQADGCLGPATLAVIREVSKIPTPATDTQTVVDQNVLKGVRPARIGVSNKIIVNKVSVPLPQVLLDWGVTASNFHDDEEKHFVARARVKKVEHLVIHESVTRDAPTTVRLLAKEDYGVHLMVAPDGHVSCHNDLMTEAPIHGNQLNSTSVGLEVVNPYTADHLRAPFTKTIPATWWTWVPKGGAKAYTTPTDSQMTTLKALIPWICELLPDLPFAFPTKDLNKKQPKIPNWDGDPKGRPGPGVVAHRDFATHADGRYILEALMG